MEYEVVYLNDAIASLKRMSLDVSRRITNKVERMCHGLTGDVKRLKAFVPITAFASAIGVSYLKSRGKSSSFTRSNIGPSRMIKRSIIMKSKYDLLVRNGKERFIVIPEKDFHAMQERLEDDADFRAIEASKIRQARSPRVPSAQVKRELGITTRRGRQHA